MKDEHRYRAQHANRRNEDLGENEVACYKNLLLFYFNIYTLTAIRTLPSPVLVPFVKRIKFATINRFLNRRCMNPERGNYNAKSLPSSGSADAFGIVDATISRMTAVDRRVVRPSVT